MRGFTVPWVGGGEFNYTQCNSEDPLGRVKSVSSLLLLLLPLLGNGVFFLPAVTGIEFYLLTSRQ